MKKLKGTTIIVFSLQSPTLHMKLNTSLLITRKSIKKPNNSYLNELHYSELFHS